MNQKHKGAPNSARRAKRRLKRFCECVGREQRHTLDYNKFHLRTHHAVTRGWARSRADPDPVECGPLSSPKTPRCRSKQPYVEVQSCCYGAQLRACGLADLLTSRGILNPAIIRFLGVVFDQIGHTAHLHPCVCTASSHAHRCRVVELRHAGDENKNILPLTHPRR